MAADSSDATLMKVAIFGITVSLICTVMISVMIAGEGGDYDYDAIQGYRNELVEFSGESMLNQTPWVLKHVYTPWNESVDPTDHTTEDGWLWGDEIKDYPGLDSSAQIRLDPTQKSTVLLGYTEDRIQYTQVDGYHFWSSKNGGVWQYLNYVVPVEKMMNWAGVSSEITSFHSPNNWNFTGYRYVFDPTLPFSATNPGGTTIGTRDGSLSLVWYSFGGQEGLSGGLDVYGGDILLASYSATDIIGDYRTESGYATVYDFDFQGTHLNLSIRFDADVIEGGKSLMQAWTEGNWSMAISSLSAGNFFDIEGSTSFTATAGNMIHTFIQIYTFNTPSIDNPWMDVLLWLIVGLPMTMAMALITLRLINGFRVL